MRILALVLALTAACGDVTGPGGGSRSDGGPDGGEPADAAVPGTVTVIVLDWDGTREPVIDTPVVFFDPDGSVAATEETDADGMASADVLPGGAVLAFTTIDAPLGVFQPIILGAVGVVPGDEITLGGRTDRGEPTDNMTFNLPPFKAIDFRVHTPCGITLSDTNPVPVQFYERCDDSPTAAVAYTFIGEDRYVVTDRNIAIEDDMPADVGSDWTLVPSPDVTIENLDDVSSMEIGWGRALLDGKNIPLGLEPLVGEVDGDQLTLSPQKVVQPDHVQLNVRVMSEQPSLGQQFWHVWMTGEGDDDDLVVDADDYRMPWIGAPVFDEATRVFEWSQIGEGEWDATYLDFNWFAQEGKGPSMFGTVRIAVPPGHHEFVVPPVPEEYEEWLPPNLDSINASVVLFDSDQLDWDEARQLGVDPGAIFDYGGTISEPAVIRYSTSQNGMVKGFN